MKVHNRSKGRGAQSGRYRRAAARSDRRWSRSILVATLSAIFVLIGSLTVGEPGRETSATTQEEAVKERRAPTNLPDARGTAPTPTPSTPTPPAPTPSPTEPVIPIAGTGEFVVAAGSNDRMGHGHLMRYTVEVESGLPYDETAIAEIIDVTLADRRSWTANGEYAFQRTSEDADIRVLLATPATTDKLCAPLDTDGEASCRNGDLVVINARRWAHGAEAYADDLSAYRQYVINHEVGHALGHPHAACPEHDERAPVMLQQTYGLDGCTPNPWPYP